MIKRKLRRALLTLLSVYERYRPAFLRRISADRLVFLLSQSSNYQGVQDNINGLIKQHLPGLSYIQVTRPEYGQYVGLQGLSFSLFIRDQSDVLMSHGVADKNYFFIKDESGRRLVNRRKHLLVPGPWLKQRLLNSKHIELTADQIHCVGWPRLDVLLEMQADHDQSKAVRPLNSERKPKVLWAPTHDKRRRGADGRSTSSYPELERYEDYFREHFDFEVALHPRNRKDKKPTAEKLVEADYVISDFGTMVYEAWALGKPVVFPSWLIGDLIQQHLRGSAEAHIFKHRIGLHAQSPEDIVDMISSGAGIGDDVKAFMEDYLPSEFNGKSSRRVATLLQDLNRA